MLPAEFTNLVVAAALFVLRLVVPVAITLALGYWLEKKLQPPAEANQDLRMRIRLVLKSHSSIPTQPHCWDLSQDEAARYAEGVAGRHPDLPCWLALQVEGYTVHPECFMCARYTSHANAARDNPMNPRRHAMSLTRRNFLKLCGASAATLGIGAKLGPPALSPAPAPVPTAKNRDSAVLFDATRCIGCKLCQITCKKVNNLPADPNVVSLSATTLTLVDFKNISPAPSKPVIKPVKRQCMHCEEPACVSVCPVGALYKKENGVVAYSAEKCIGCRYCMTACPFEAPNTIGIPPTPRLTNAPRSVWTTARARCLPASRFAPCRLFSTGNATSC